MPAGITNVLANEMLIRASSYALFISLHNADPGSTGANEQSGAPYGRRAAAWTPPTSGALRIAGPVHMAVNAGSNVGFYGLWTTTSGVSSFCGGSSLSAVEAFVAAGTYTVSSLTFSIPII
jgi:hypothetical protein